MPRDDYERRRLYALYERSKRRLAALADARDRRRENANEDFAPRRFLVSERKLRSEGFGRGGAQVRRVWRRQRGGDAVRAERRFADRGIFRRGNRDRFRREDDMDRELRRERMLDETRVGRRERRFGLARRRRLQVRESRRGGAQSRPRSRERNNEAPRRGRNKTDRRAAGGGKAGAAGGGAAQMAAGRPRAGQGRRRANEPLPTRDQLDAQLDSYRNN